MYNNNNKKNINNILELFSKISILFVISIFVILGINNVRALEVGADTISVIAREYQGGPEATGYVSTIPAELQGKYDKNAYLGYIRESSRQTKKITEPGNYNDILFCLDDTLEFPTLKAHTYQKLGELKNVSKIAENKTLSQTQKNKLYYFLERTYFREEATGDTQAQAAALKKDRFRRSYYYNLDPGSSSIPNPTLAETSAIRAYMLNITDDDYALINQWIIWYIVSGNDLFTTLPMSMATNNGIVNPTPERTTLRKQLYQYLKADVDQNGANYTKYLQGTTSLEQNVITGGTTYSETDTGFELKHFTVDIPTGQEAAVTDIKMYYADKDQHALGEVPRSDYKIIKEDGTEETGNLKSLNKKGKFKIVFKRKLTEQEDGIRFETIINNTGLQANVYTPKLDKRYQPIVHISRKPKEKRFAFVLKKVKPEPPENDLALRKFITSIDGVAPQVDRTPKLDVSKLRNKLNKSGTDTTITYKHPKNPLKAKIGSTVQYTIRIYNEVTTPGKVTKVIDQLPPHLKLKENSQINQQYGWVQEAGNKVSTTYYQNTTIPGMSYSNNSLVVPTLDLKIEVVVLDTAQPGHKQTNIAYIAGQNPLPDRDSTPGNTNIPTNLEEYKGHNTNKAELGDPNYHYKGQEDDDDFESVVIEEPETDLALRKSIMEIDGVAPQVNREPQVDTSKLKNDLNPNGTETTAEYKHPKNPLKAKIGSTVKYRIRVFNETTKPGKVTEIIDKLPLHMKLKENSQINQQYGWVQKDGYIATKALENQIIQPAKLENGKIKLDSKYVEVELVILDTVKSTEVLTNVAYIENQLPKKDRDSTPGNTKVPKDLSPYKGNGNNKADLADPNYHYKGQEDDDDFEKVIVEIPEADLALRKFIDKVVDQTGKETIVDRIPKVNVDPLLKGKTTAEYKHPKDPVTVLPENTVYYTIRVYNEGELDAYVKKVQDNVPEGLEFLPDNEINKQYQWKLIEKEENGVKKKIIESDYLSKESATKRGEGPIKAFDPKKAKEENPLDFRDLKIAFKVSKDFKSKDGIIENIAEITDIEDPNGKQLKDRDSTPGNNKDGEDDIDKEKLQTPKFDLALRKIVSKIFVTTNGKTKTIKTGHKYPDEPEEVAKVELDSKKWDKTTVKYEFKMRITNEGNIPGYATEISDYIPKGLKFNQEDNPEWKVTRDRNGLEIATTDQLKDKLLQPGETAEVSIILDWIKDKNNFGVKTNWAEISKDKNEYGIPDIDSVPGNNKKGEDDIDYAPVALSIATGKAFTYFIATTTILSIVGVGTYGIKKYFLTNIHTKL